MEITEITNIKELPIGVEFVLYEPPYSDEDKLSEAVGQFKSKKGHEPIRAYVLGERIFLQVKGE